MKPDFYLIFLHPISLENPGGIQSIYVFIAEYSEKTENPILNTFNNLIKYVVM